jgi:hypothetical protein
MTPLTKFSKSQSGVNVKVGAQHCCTPAHQHSISNRKLVLLFRDRNGMSEPSAFLL